MSYHRTIYEQLEASEVAERQQVMQPNTKNVVIQARIIPHGLSFQLLSWSVGKIYIDLKRVLKMQCFK